MDHERELLERARSGDTGAFDEIVTSHRTRVYALLFQILRNEDDAMDLTQDTFIRAWRSLNKFDGRHPVATWLHRIATNAAIDLIRRHQVRPQCELSDGPMAIDAASRTTPSAPAIPGEALDRRDLRKALDKALGLVSIEDLLRHYPRRYAERAELTELEGAEGGLAGLETLHVVQLGGHVHVHRFVPAGEVGFEVLVEHRFSLVRPQASGRVARSE